MKLSSPILAAAPVLAVLACSNLPERGTDTVRVEVGDVSVFLRERFVADRYADLEWLRKQKESKDYEQGLQGSSSTLTREITGLSARATFDTVSGVDLANGDEEAGAPTTADVDATGSALRFLPDAVGKDALAGPKDGALRTSPRDLLRNRLALRDEIGAAIRQRALDDTHDLESSTMYDLQFDLTLVPGENAGSAHVVMLELEAVENVLDCSSTENSRCSRWQEALKGAVLREVSTTGYYAGVRGATQTLTTRNSPLASRAMIEGSYLAAIDLLDAGEALAEEEIERQRSRLDEVDAALRGGALDVSISTQVRTLRNQYGRIAFKTDLGPYRIWRGLGFLNLQPSNVIRAQERLTGDDQRLAKEIRATRTRTRAFAKLTVNLAKSRELLTAMVALIEGAEPSRPEPESTTEALVDRFSSGGDGAGFEIMSVPVAPIAASGLFQHSEGAPRSAASFFRGRLAGTSHALTQELDAITRDLHMIPKGLAGRYTAIRAQVLFAKSRSEQLHNCVTVEDVPTDAAGYFTALYSSEVNDQFDNLVDALTGDAGARRPLRIVSVSPEEQAEQLSTTAQSEIQTFLDLAAQAQAGSGAAFGASLKSLRAELERYDMIQRNPLVVGFIDGNGSGTGSARLRGQERPRVGWVLGPRLETSTKGDATLRYRFVPQHYAVGMRVIAHGGVTQMNFKVRVYEIRGDGTWREIEEGLRTPYTDDNKLTVTLPGDPAAVLRGHLFQIDQSTAEPDLVPEKWTVRTDARAEFVLQGRNLWRSPRVFLGGQPADQVTILPNLGGVSARFDKVAPQYAPSGEPDPVSVDLVIATSQGSDVLQGAVRVLPKKDPSKKERPKGTLANKTWPATITSKKATLDLDFECKPPLPDSGYAYQLRIERPGALGPISNKVLDPKAIVLSKKRDKLSLLAVEFPMDGKTVDFFDLNLSLTPTLGADPYSLTGGDQRIAILSKSFSLQYAGKPAAKGKADVDSKTLTTEAALDIEAAVGERLNEAIRSLLPDLAKASGVKAKVKVGSAEFETAVRIVSDKGSHKLRFTLPKDTKLEGMAFKDGDGGKVLDTKSVTATIAMAGLGITLPALDITASSVTQPAPAPGN